ncbi:MAG: hypothetical protein ACLVIY_13275 [Anaerobutyricum soehngenii]
MPQFLKEEKSRRSRWSSDRERFVHKIMELLPIWPEFRRKSSFLTWIADIRKSTYPESETDFR